MRSRGRSFRGGVRVARQGYAFGGVLYSKSTPDFGRDSCCSVSFRAYVVGTYCNYIDVIQKTRLGPIVCRLCCSLNYVLVIRVNCCFVQITVEITHRLCRLYIGVSRLSSIFVSSFSGFGEKLRPNFCRKKKNAVLRRAVTRCTISLTSNWS